jgi:hypothetical protein
VGSLDNEAGLLVQLGRTPEAIACLERALRLRETLGNRSAEATALVHLGKMLRESDEARSRELLERGLSLAEGLPVAPLAEQARAELAKLPPGPPRAEPEPHAVPTNGAATEDPVKEEAPHHPVPPIARAVAWIDKKLELRWPSAR